MDKKNVPNRLELILEEYQNRVKEKGLSLGPPTPGLVMIKDSIAREHQKLEKEIQGVLQELSALKNNWSLPGEQLSPTENADPDKETYAEKPAPPMREEGHQGQERMAIRKEQGFLSKVKSWFS
ncbi:MAG: hypothetical protein AAB091_01770 [Elusimicrobiota bacterium]